MQTHVKSVCLPNYPFPGACLCNKAIGSEAHDKSFSILIKLEVVTLIVTAV